MKIAVLGLGSIGTRHLANAQALGHEVRGYDPAFRGVLGSREEAIAWAEAVIIAMPAALHAETLALCRGKHVLVEKPLALSAVDLAEHVSDLAPRGQTAMVGYNLRFHPAIAAMREALPRIGSPYAATFYLLCDMRTWPGKSYGDPLLECSHEIDLALHLLGPAVVVHATCVDHTWSIVLRHRACYSFVKIATRAKLARRGGTISGVDGHLAWSWDVVSGEASCVMDPGFVKTFTVSPDDTYRAEMAHFLASISHPTRPLDPAATLVAGAAVLSTCDSARQFVANKSLLRK